ncbi:MAG: (Fe-S)-binding protein [Deltaproteobacteria bacterium]|nr:(Fe-S)-binding protein [Deltaproteobacteria bacterium]
MQSVIFHPDLCASCKSISCLMRCQYIEFSGIDEARAERKKINSGLDSRVLHECLTCYSCQEYCPNGNNPFFFLVEQQEKLGILPAPIPIVKEQLAMMAPRGRLEPQKAHAPVVDMCAFPMLTGCIRPPLFENASVFSGTDFFCNIMWLHFAKNSTIFERVPKMIENIMTCYLKDSGPDEHSMAELICFHDECYGTYTTVANAYSIPVPFKPIHLFDYIDKKLDELSGKIKPLNAVIAYQRPCSNRLIPETDKTLDRIFEKIGVTRAARKYDRQNALCCGGVPRAHQRDDFADELLEKNLNDMVASGATYCVFNCPFCMATLAEAVAEKGLFPILVSDLVQTALGG